jgi:hypothetical protein
MHQVPPVGLVSGMMSKSISTGEGASFMPETFIDESTATTTVAATTSTFIDEFESTTSGTNVPESELLSTTEPPVTSTD